MRGLAHLRAPFEGHNVFDLYEEMAQQARGAQDGTAKPSASVPSGVGPLPTGGWGQR